MILYYTIIGKKTIKKLRNDKNISIRNEKYLFGGLKKSKNN